MSTLTARIHCDCSIRLSCCLCTHAMLHVRLTELTEERVDRSGSAAPVPSCLLHAGPALSTVPFIPLQPARILCAMREPFTLLPHAGGRRATSCSSSMLDSPAQVARFAPLAGAGASPLKPQQQQVQNPPASSVKANTRHDITDKEIQSPVARTPSYKSIPAGGWILLHRKVTCEVARADAHDNNSRTVSNAVEGQGARGCRSFTCYRP